VEVSAARHFGGELNRDARWQLTGWAGVKSKRDPSSLRSSRLRHEGADRGGQAG